MFDFDTYTEIKKASLQELNALSKKGEIAFCLDEYNKWASPFNVHKYSEIRANVRRFLDSK